MLHAKMRWQLRNPRPDGTVTFEYADNVLTGLGRPEAWHEIPELSVYLPPLEQLDEAA